MTCPICDKVADAKYRPFCSKHCADVDLGRWFNGAYAVPAQPLEEIDKAQAEPENTPPKPH